MSKGSTAAKRRAAVRRRRTLLAIIVLVIVAAVTLLVWQPWAGGTPAPTAPGETATPGAAETPAPSGTPASSDTPAPSETQPFTPIGDNPTAPASEPCAPEQIRLTPQTDRSTYGEGDPVQLSFTIENTGDAACSLDAGTGAQEYEIRTGDELVYRWSDCAADVTENIVSLEPGQPQSTVPIEWDRTRSSSDTCTTERDEVSAGGAAYKLTVSVGELTSQEPRQFILE